MSGCSPRRRGRVPKGAAWWMLAALLLSTCNRASPASGLPGTATALPSQPVASAPGHAASPTLGREAAAAEGTARRIEFRRLTIEDGLSQSTINCIVQDSRGFMWFGTQDGLNRYDGYEFRVYEHDRDDPHSLSNNWVQHCYRDPQDASGLSPRMPSSTVTTRPWTVSTAPAARWRPAQAGPNQHPHPLWRQRRPVMDRHLRRRPGRVRSRRGPPHLLPRRPGRSAPARRARQQGIHHLEDSAGTLWFGTGEGLVRYDELEKSFVRYPYQAEAGDPPDPRALRSPFVTNLYEDAAGRFWVGTTYGGLHELDRETGRFTAYPYSADEPNTFPETRFVRCSKTGRANCG
jgi:hypothetical protein